MNDGLFKCLSDSNRRRILYCIGENEMCVNNISECLGLEQSLVSHHLRELYQCGLVERERKGKKNFYRISGMEIIELLKSASKLGDSLEECANDQ